MIRELALSHDNVFIWSGTDLNFVPNTHTVDNDISVYYLDQNQKWKPRVCTSDVRHPAKVGDMVTVKHPSLLGNKASVVFVSGVRTFKNYRSAPATRQIEILGMPCKWFSIGHFEEYTDASSRVYCRN